MMTEAKIEKIKSWIENNFDPTNHRAGVATLEIMTGQSLYTESPSQNTGDRLDGFWLFHFYTKKRGITTAKILVHPARLRAAAPVVMPEALAAEIRRVDGNHSLGAAALAEALMPFLRSLSSPAPVEGFMSEDQIP